MHRSCFTILRPVGRRLVHWPQVAFWEITPNSDGPTRAKGEPRQRYKGAPNSLSVSRVAAISGGIRFHDATALKQRDLAAACREATRASLERFRRKLEITLEL